MNILSTLKKPTQIIPKLSKEYYSHVLGLLDHLCFILNFLRFQDLLGKAQLLSGVPRHVPGVPWS